MSKRLYEESQFCISGHRSLDEGMFFAVSNTAEFILSCHLEAKNHNRGIQFKTERTVMVFLATKG